MEEKVSRSIADLLEASPDIQLVDQQQALTIDTDEISALLAQGAKMHGYLMVDNEYRRIFLYYRGKYFRWEQRGNRPVTSQESDAATQAQTFSTD